MSDTSPFRAIVVGGGPAGLAAAALLGVEGIAATIVAPQSAGDPRTVALMKPSLRFLSRLGIWPGKLAEVSAPLRHLHIVDDTGGLMTPPRLEFSASELNADSFGWNVPLAALVPELMACASARGVTVISSKAASASVDDRCISIVLENGDALSAPVAIAADGVESLLRKAAGISAESWSFDQEALVTSFAHSGPHHDISTEFHKKGGAFTTVPLPGQRSSLVWMGTPENLRRLAALAPQELAMEIQLENHGTLGCISDVQPTRSFAMRGLRAARFAANRVFLVGEAAHVFPPLGAQGLNMSLRDAGHAVDLIVGAKDAGLPSVMDEYDRLRRPDIVQRETLIGLVNRSLLADVLPMSLLRAASLSLVSLLPPLRNLVMQEGLAPSTNLPFAMRG